MVGVAMLRRTDPVTRVRAMRSACIADLRFTVNNFNIQSVTQNCFRGEFMSQATIKHT
jgi:hypothetical protein